MPTGLYYSYGGDSSLAAPVSPALAKVSDDFRMAKSAKEILVLISLSSQARLTLLPIPFLKCLLRHHHHHTLSWSFSYSFAPCLLST